MKYPFRVYKVHENDHDFWIADSQALKGCTGQGDTADEALAELAENETVWLETAEKYGIEIPDVPTEELTEYSGKMTLRMSPSTHRDLAKYAAMENISQNQYVNEAIVAKNARMEDLHSVNQEARAIREELRRTAGIQQSYGHGTYQGVLSKTKANEKWNTN